MIRFSCPHCGREYLLADALAHLSLICKGCGQRLTVPDPEPEPPPAPPPPPPPPKSHPTPEPESILREGEAPAEPQLPARREPRPPAKHIPAPESVDEPFISPETLAQLDHTAKPPPEAGTETKPAGNRKALARVADAAVVLALLVIGALLGEVVARKPTGEILSNAGSAPKFPPTDLLLWLGCVAFFGLAYAWLGTRGWTVGGWLRRRA